MNNLLINKEKDIKEEINKIQEAIEKKAKSVKLNDIFDEFKLDLINKIQQKNEYLTIKDIFTDKNVKTFGIENLYSFLKEHLKDYSFSISKKDITNYNLFIDVITKFPELYIIYKNDIDVDFQVLKSK